MRTPQMVVAALRAALAPTLRCAVLALLSAVVLVVGCDTSVDALRVNDDFHYSIFGVLDPAQDTQWVRVEPLKKPTSGGSPPSLDVTVRLENLATNQQWALRDSFMLVEGEMHHNFWTDAPVVPSTSYKVTVKGDSGEVTTASTTTPSRPPSLEIEDPMRLPCSPVNEINQFVVSITDVQQVAAAKMAYFQSVFGPPSTAIFDHYDDITRGSDTTYSVLINYAEDLQQAQRTRERRCLADSAEVIVAAGGPDWPEWARYEDASIVDLARPDSFSNVQGGHGLFSGVFSTKKDVPIRIRDN